MLKKLYSTPRNPYVPGRDAKDLFECNLSGTRFSIEVFPTNYGYTIGDRSDDVVQVNLYDSDCYGEHELKDFQKGWPRSCLLFKRKSVSYGGLFGRTELGILNINASVRYFDDIPDWMNLFNPEHMELAIDRLCYFGSGPGAGVHQYAAPCNWRIVRAAEESWIYYEKIRWKVFNAWRFNQPLSDPLAGPGGLARRSGFFCLPLSKKHFLVVVAGFHGWPPVEDALACFAEWRDECFNTVQVSYSEQALQDKAEAQALWPETQYSQNREPVEWTYHKFVNEDEGGDDEVEVWGDPPPPWPDQEQQVRNVK